VIRSRPIRPRCYSAPVCDSVPLALMRMMTKHACSTEAGRGFRTPRAAGTHQQSADPVPQVRDLVEVLVCGSVVGQLLQILGGAARADSGSGIKAHQGRVSENSAGEAPATMQRCASSPTAWEHHHKQDQQNAA
jgi:hypothetical protein